MKFPVLRSLQDVLPDLYSFDALIDVRSPSEFAEDHIPGAINCPVLDDKERERVGTLYKQLSSFDAKKLGAALVSRNIALHIEKLFQKESKDWKPLVYCWRGGNRSGSMAHVLARIGWPAVQLDGGYKAYRRHVNEALAVLPQQFCFTVVCGTTGSGKSRLLQTLATQGAQVLDLEMLAAHRGSVLGHLPSEAQPAQKAFESRIWNLLRSFDPNETVFIESESKKVGNLRVPDALMEKMRASPCVSLTLAASDRVKLLMEDYTHFITDPASMNDQLDCLIPIHGKDRISRWQSMSSAGETAVLVEELLTHHYDPAYLRSIERNFRQFPQAVQIALADISDASFHSLASHLIKGK